MRKTVLTAVSALIVPAPLTGSRFGRRQVPGGAAGSGQVPGPGRERHDLGPDRGRPAGADNHVKTGTDGFVQGLPRCDTDGVEPGETPPGNAVHGRGNGPAGPSTGTNAQKVQRVIDTAKSQTGNGYLYSWGAGGEGGASYGVHHYPDNDPAQGDDYNRLGYDCSGLTLYAFWKGAGLDIGAWTGAQHTKGRADRKPGDLVFWGRSDNDADSTTHVALYLGDDEILEASPPRDGDSAQVSELDSHGTPCTKVRRIFG